MIPINLRDGSSANRKSREFLHVSKLDLRTSKKVKAVIVRRDTREKIVTPIEKIEETLAEVLETMQNDMYNKAKAHLEKNTHIAHNWKSLMISLRISRDSSAQCGVEKENVKKPIKDENGATTTLYSICTGKTF